MSARVEIIVHEVAADGLPDMEALVGQVAFIWDGAVVSGWPIGEEFGGVQYGEQLWEPSEDRFGGPVAGVTHWIEFPVPAWNLVASFAAQPTGDE